MSAVAHRQHPERDELPSPYVDLDRDDWAQLRRNHPMSLTIGDLARLRGLGDQVDLGEVEQIYLPLSRLLTFYVDAVEALSQVTGQFLGEPGRRTPFVIGVAGSVAVGKSTTARILRELLTRWPSTPRVELVTTDGFLLPNAELQARGILHRKGFPESYDRHGLIRFVADVKSGRDRVQAPVYSHLTYDIVPGRSVVVERPDVLIVEGLNVLQMPRTASGRPGRVLSDYLDFSVYVHARTQDLRDWYIQRFLRLRETAFADPASYFHRYASLSDEQARETAARIWAQTNEPNLRENIRPTRSRANLILAKGPEHRVTRIRLRKL